MERWKKQVLALVIISSVTFIIVDMNYVFFWEIPPHNFEWAISVGDEFQFSVTDSSSYDSAITEDPFPSKYLPVVNHTIRVRILSLPNLTISSESDFLLLVEAGKVACSFANGTPLPSITRTALNELISHLILPIGGWNYIDWLYADNYDDVSSNYIFDTYFSHSEEDYFQFEYKKAYIDYSNGWEGRVSFDSGIPSMIRTYSYQIGSPNGYSWSLIMNLI